MQNSTELCTRVTFIFVHFLAVLHDYDVKMPKFAFYGE